MVRITWTATAGATGYDVYRYTSNSNASATKLNPTTIIGTTFDDTTTLAGITYYYWVKAKRSSGDSVFSSSDSGYRAQTLSPASREIIAGGAIGQTIAVTSSASWTAASNSSWLVITGGSTGSGNGTVTYTVSANTGPASRSGTISVAGQTHVVTQPAETGRATIIGGTGALAGSNIIHSNGNIYDQVLITGSTATIQASPGKIVRTSYLDLSDDIVQVEFSGAGTVTITLAGSSGPALPAQYNQAVSYMKGHASITVQGTDNTSNLTVFSVGRMTAVNQALFSASINYDGFADIASITIQASPTTGVGSFGGLRAANAHLWGTSGTVGLNATGITFSGPLFIHDIEAYDSATPMLKVASASDVRITGGDLEQPNGRVVQVDGFNRVQMAAGTDSHGRLQPAQPIRGRLERNGADVTTQMVPGG